MSQKETKMKKMGAIVQSVLEKATGKPVSIIEVAKQDGIRHGVTIKEDNAEGVAPVLYLENWYDRYDKGENIIDICMEMLEIYQKNACDVKNADYKQMLLDYEKVKDRICFRIVKKEYYEIDRFLNDTFLDLNVLYYVMLDGSDDEQNVTANITHQLVKLWNVTEEEVKNMAKENTERLMPSQISNFGPLTIMSTKSSLFGASTMLYKDAIQKYAQEIGSDLYILPCSVHELILHPMNDLSDPQFLRELISTTNESTVEEELRLSDSLYRYIRGGEIELAS